MPPTAGDTTEYDRYQMADRYYAAQEQEKRRIEEYATYRAYEDLRTMALTYVDQVLRYKFDAGDTSLGLREWLAANYGIPNTREARWVGDIVVKNVIYNKDVDTKQLIGDAFGEYHFRHRKPMMEDLRTVSQIEFARAKAREAEAASKNSASLQQQHRQGQQQQQQNNNNNRNLSRAEIIQKIKDTAETIGQCANMMVNEYHLHNNLTDARAECFKIIRRGR